MYVVAIPFEYSALLKCLFAVVDGYPGDNRTAVP